MHCLASRTNHCACIPLLAQVVLIDSAGLRQTECPIEAEGVRRAVAAAQQAHVVLHLADASRTGAGEQPDEAPSSALQLLPGAAQLWVLNKADMLGAEAGGVQQQASRPSSAAAAAVAAAAQAAAACSAAPPLPQRPLVISCKTGEGIEQLLAALQGEVQALVSSSAGDDGVAGALVTRARHRQVGLRSCEVPGEVEAIPAAGCICRPSAPRSSTRAHASVPLPLLLPTARRHHLAEAAACLARYSAVAAEFELGCEELRAAARALGRVTGAIDTEQVLDSIFSEFCIGK